MYQVAALCVGPNSVYKGMPHVDAYDKARDARSFPGGLPVVGHPPCRSWSAYCAHQAKPEPGEQELALWVVSQLRLRGGVLEHPAHSRLWTAAGLPLPGEPAADGCFSLEVSQQWWGHPVRKRTWLCFFGIERSELPAIPFQLMNPTVDDRRTWALMSKHQRSATPPGFASWLVDAARLAVPGRGSAVHLGSPQRLCILGDVHGVATTV